MGKLAAASSILRLPCYTVVFASTGTTRKVKTRHLMHSLCRQTMTTSKASPLLDCASTLTDYSPPTAMDAISPRPATYRGTLLFLPVNFWLLTTTVERGQTPLSQHPAQYQVVHHRLIRLNPTALRWGRVSLYFPAIGISWTMPEAQAAPRLMGRPENYVPQVTSAREYAAYTYYP